MAAVNQWEREAIAERTRHALRHKRRNGERVGNMRVGYKLAADVEHVEAEPAPASIQPSNRLGMNQK